MQQHFDFKKVAHFTTKFRKSESIPVKYNPKSHLLYILCTKRVMYRAEQGRAGQENAECWVQSNVAYQDQASSDCSDTDTGNPSCCHSIQKCLCVLLSLCSVSSAVLFATLLY